MQVSIRELKANPAHAIALMQRGETVQITSHRKVVAELVPPRTNASAKPALSDEQAMQKLIDSGAVAQMPTKRFTLPVPVLFPPSEDGKSMSDLVAEMRGPR
ncbi:MAG: type II toxin-antitoxin system Phd/YefM family antitoxin [Polaromonas sp.]|nr:type II toxin-antitoxin system Phd/YefM family antitoxin [Polaromonas sp.]